LIILIIFILVTTPHFSPKRPTLKYSTWFPETLAGSHYAKAVEAQSAHLIKETNMRTKTFSATLISVLLLTVMQSQAQAAADPVKAGSASAAVTQPATPDQAKPANPRDVIPDAMLNNIPYGIPISLDKADAAIAESKKRNWNMNIAVVDSGANLVAFKRMDGAQLGSIPTAQHKARVAVKYRRETKAFEDAIQTNPAVATLDDMIASRGGIPIIVDGKIIGAIGCTGGMSSQDEVVCKAAIAAIK
jgi:glc operon protein GlcG